VERYYLKVSKGNKMEFERVVIWEVEMWKVEIVICF
jgi:hypothetical protein